MDTNIFHIENLFFKSNFVVFFCPNRVFPEPIQTLDSYTFPSRDWYYMWQWHEASKALKSRKGKRDSMQGKSLKTVQS
jgi:hypothetical protein